MLLFIKNRSPVLCSIAAALLLGSIAGPARAETTSETDGIAHPASAVIVDPLDGAVFAAPASFTVRIESEDASSSPIESVKLQIDGENVAGSCVGSGVCNIDVVDLAAGEHILIAIVDDLFDGVMSEPVTITVQGAETTGASESETAAATDTEAASEGGEAPTTGGEGPGTDGDSETEGGEANDDDLVGKGCGCVAGGGADPLALGLLLMGVPMLRRRRV